MVTTQIRNHRKSNAKKSFENGADNEQALTESSRLRTPDFDKKVKRARHEASCSRVTGKEEFILDNNDNEFEEFFEI